MLELADLDVIRVIVLLAAVAGFAYVVNLPSVRRWEDRLGITQLAIAGLPFIALGMLARSSELLDEKLLGQLSPLIAIALTVVGIRAGLRFDIPRLLATTRAPALLAGTRLAFGWITTFATALAVYRAVGWGAEDSQVRDALILALAGSVTSAATGRGLRGLQAIDDMPLSERVIGIGKIASLLGFLLLTVRVRSVFAPPLPVPPILWLLVALGLSIVLAFLMLALLRDRAVTGEHAAVLAIGTVAVVGGVATYLGFAPLCIGALVGASLGQLLARRRDAVVAAFERYNRSIYALLLFVLGAMALPLTWFSALVAITFVLARGLAHVGATRLGLFLSGTRVDHETLRRLGVSPLGATAIAIVISAQTIYPEAQLAPVIVAVICAAMVTEAMFRVPPLLDARRRPAPELERAA